MISCIIISVAYTDKDRIAILSSDPSYIYTENHNNRHGTVPIMKFYLTRNP